MPVGTFSDIAAQIFAFKTGYFNVTVFSVAILELGRNMHEILVFFHFFFQIYLI